MSLPDCYPDERMDRIYCVAPIVSGVGPEQVRYFVTVQVFTCTVGANPRHVLYLYLRLEKHVRRTFRHAKRRPRCVRALPKATTPGMLGGGDGRLAARGAARLPPFALACRPFVHALQHA